MNTLTLEKAKLVKLIHVAKRELTQKGMLRDDADYRLLLQSATASRPGLLDGPDSTRQMDLAQLDQVLKAMRAKGFRLRLKPGTRPLDNDALARKLRALWLDLHNLGIVKNPAEEALAAFAKRHTGLDALQWATTEQLSALVEKLKQWKKRTEKPKA